MNMEQDELQRRLEALEAGEPFTDCVAGLDGEDAELLELVTNLRHIPIPARDAAHIAAQRANLMEKVQPMEIQNTQTRESKVANAWTSFRAWIQNADKYDWAVVGAMAPAVLLILFGIIGGLRSVPPTTSPSMIEEAAFDTVSETAVESNVAETQIIEETASVTETGQEVAAVSETAVSVSIAPTTPDTAALSDIRGLVQVQSSDGSWQNVTAATTLHAGQRLQTGSLSGATLTFYDGSVATIGPDAELWIDALNANPDDVRVIALTQWAGITDHKVAKSEAEGSRYEVRTPTATSVARGTEFTVMMTADLSTRVNVDEGAVDVTGQESTVLTVAGQTTAVSAGETPTEPTYTVTGEGEVNQIGETWIIAGQPFLTNGSTIIIGNPQVGDIVFVKGHLNEDGSTTADVIGLLRPAVANTFTLSGIVNAMDATWDVSGKIIAVDENTIIEADLALGDEVIVNGIILEDGTFLAQEISRKDTELTDPFAFTGVIQTTGTDEWTISGIAIAVDESTEIDADLAAGDTVKVAGHILEGGVWLATEIKLVEPAAQPFEFTGIVDSMEPWSVAGIALATNDWTEIEEGIAVGDRVKVEGVIQVDGTWLANEIKLADEELDTSIIEFTGTVDSMEPWVVSGIALTSDENSLIADEIVVGTAVHVIAQIQADGSLLILEMTPIEEFGSGCLGYTSLIMAVADGQITLLDGSTIALTEDIVVSGELAPGAVVMILVCTSADGTQIVTSIVVIYQLDTPPVVTPTPVPPTPVPPAPQPQPGNMVTLCHNANKNNPHTITVAEAAVNAHLGHGDTLGPCP